MESILETLNKRITPALKTLDYGSINANIVASNREDLCDYQCNVAFSLAKQYRKQPIVIANEIINVLKNTEDIAIFEVVKPGYINISLKNEYILSVIRKIQKEKNFGFPSFGIGKKIVIDFGGPNIAKPLHVGHLRSAVIGESLKRMAKVCGYEVISDIHLGDWGLQMGLVILELLERGYDYKEFTLTANLLNEIYPIASEKSKNDIEYRNRAKKITYYLQKGRKDYLKIWESISELSIRELKRDYSRLDVDFDLWLGESDANRYVNELLMRLENRNLLTINEGAKVVSFNNECPPAIIIKSDNSIMYTTTDLATIIQREKEYFPEMIWYVVDNRQELHFKQVFSVAKMANLVTEKTKLEFISFGTMNGQDNKPYKTRDGGVMRLSTLIEKAVEEIKAKVIVSDYISPILLDETSNKIAVAAIKFGDLINYREKDYIFNLDKFIASEGKTGVYILYNIARINSIFEKCKDRTISNHISDFYSLIERKILIQIINSHDLFKRAILDRSPNIIAENVYKISNLYSSFYNNNLILKETDESKKSDWLSLSKLVREVLIFNLDLLGIQSVDKM